MRRFHVFRVTFLALPIACSPAAPTHAPSPPPVTPSVGTHGDTPGLNLVPAGYGTLRQDDISLKLRLPQVLVRVTPLDESVIRLLSPDSYRALRSLRDGQQKAIAKTATRLGVSTPSLWYFSYFGLEPDARFTARDANLVSGGRDFRPLDVIPLTSGFGDGRVGQREVQSAIYLFGNGIDPYHVLTITIEGVSSTDWKVIIPVLEREQALVRSRSSQKSDSVR